MMKHRSFFHPFFAGLLLATAPLLSQCGGDAGFGTETGNPPGIEQKKLHLELVDAGLRVVGSPGAVAPGGASVRVTNVRTGDSVQTTAADDGSFEVAIAGGASDELVVSVLSGGQEASERISLSDGATDLGSTSCEALDASLRETLRGLFESAEAACTTDADCVRASYATASVCFVGCASVYLSSDAAYRAYTQGPELTAALCEALEPCPRPDSLCAEPGLPVCRAGVCQGVAASTLQCDDISDLARARRERLRSSADKACTTNADCALASVYSGCIVECGPSVESVAVGSVDSLEASIRSEIDGGFCAAYIGRNCSLPELDCPLEPANPTAVCDAGTCAISDR
ncbi:MAG TPA: carboxypeptidase-like regulatory domain-containing protein [Polyangiaceae bacterium]|nr:carboxypeptidase-like regulatory domain-containing protein [Polyangiaceae bacterium]